MLQEIADWLIKREPPSYDDTFEMLLQKEFWSDLRVAAILRSIPEYERTPTQEVLFDYLKETYVPSGDCPSTLYPHVSKHLQDNYRAIHDTICTFLHN